MPNTVNIPDFSKALNLGKDFWLKEIGGYIRKWIKEDALNHLMQNGRKNIPYRSRQYMKYKANRMERFTDRTGPKGTKLEALKNRPIESNDTSAVNMTLTGDTINGLRPIHANANGVTMAFASKDTGKILGNQRRGYDIVGLNDKNIKRVKMKILDQFDKNLRKTLLKQINIQIGK